MDRCADDPLDVLARIETLEALLAELVKAVAQLAQVPQVPPLWTPPDDWEQSVTVHRCHV